MSGAAQGGAAAPAASVARPAFDALPFPDVPFGLARPEEVAALDGLEAMRRIPRGDLPAPPAARTTRQWISAVERGRVEFRGDPHPDFLNPMGLIHGGWTMTLLDSALGCAVATMLAAGQGYVSLGTEAKFIRPVMAETGQVRATATVLSLGRRTATAEARVEDRFGRLLATGTTTCFIDTLKGPAASRG
ncbi:MAG: PaaI family thioesterase [Pseudooceanicola sp.]